MNAKLIPAVLLLLLVGGCKHNQVTFAGHRRAAYFASSAYSVPKSLAYEQIDMAAVNDDVDPDWQSADRPAVSRPTDNWDDGRVLADFSRQQDDYLSSELADALVTIRQLRRDNLQLETLLDISETRLSSALGALRTARVRAWNSRNYVVLLSCIDAENVLVHWSYYQVTRRRIYRARHPAGNVYYRYRHNRPGPSVLARVRRACLRTARLARNNRRLRRRYARQISQLRDRLTAARLQRPVRRPAATRNRHPKARSRGRVRVGDRIKPIRKVKVRPAAVLAKRRAADAAAIMAANAAANATASEKRASLQARRARLAARRAELAAERQAKLVKAKTIVGGKRASLQARIADRRTRLVARRVELAAARQTKLVKAKTIASGKRASLQARIADRRTRLAARRAGH